MALRARRRTTRRPALLRRGDRDERLRFGLLDFELRLDAERLVELFFEDLPDERLDPRDEDLGVRARRADFFLDAERETDRLFEALGVLLLREALRREALRREARRLDFREADLLGDLGVRARRVEALRLVLLLFDALGVRLRLRLRLRFNFFAALGFDTERALFFLIPINLFLLSFIACLYWFLPSTHVLYSLVFT